jgi:hypothetical protein
MRDLLVSLRRWREQIRLLERLACRFADAFPLLEEARANYLATRDLYCTLYR